MYRGFKLDYCYYHRDYCDIGKQLYSELKQEVRQKVHDLTKEKVINGTLLEQEWFPTQDFTVFISHSHLNEMSALTLAGWLYHNFNIKAFIDSYVWGYSEELLKEIDDIYCLNDKNNYSYEKRNISTSHIHMMLNCALLKMIDKTECFMFLKTPESLTIDKIFDGESTYSPWIYSELLMSNLIRRKSLESHRGIHFQKSLITEKTIVKSLLISYKPELSHLTNINYTHLDKWKEVYNNEDYPLDILYELFPENENEKFNKLLED